MSNFYFQITDDEGTISSIEFNSETWIDAFPKFLAVCRGAGFRIVDETALYSPPASKKLFSDRDFLIFDDELVDSNHKPEVSKDHSKSYYDYTRNR